MSREPGSEPGTASARVALIEFSIDVCQLILVALMLLVSISVVCRIVGEPIEVSEELAGYLLVAFTFLSLAGCAVHGAYHRVELLTSRLGRRAVLGLEQVFIAVSLAATLLLDWYLVSFVMQSYASGDVAPTELATPLWIPECLMPMGTTLLVVGLLVILRRNLRLLRAHPAEDGQA